MTNISRKQIERRLIEMSWGIEAAKPYEAPEGCKWAIYPTTNGYGHSDKKQFFRTLAEIEDWIDL